MAAIESRAWPVRQTWAAFTALHRVGDAIITADGQGRVELLNPAAEALTGWKDKEAEGRPLDEVFRLVDKETRENLESPVTRIVRDGPIVKQPDHAILLDREGTARPIAYSGAPVRDDHGAIAGVVVAFRDQTGEPAAQRMPRDSQSMLGSVLDTIPVRVFWKDLEGKFLGCNASFARDSGFSTPSELIGKDDFQMGWKREAELYRADDRQVTETGIPKIGFEEPQTTPTGGCRWLRTSKIPLRDDEGHTIGVLGTYEDITPRKEAEIALQESEARFRSLFENNHTVMFVIDPESGAIVDANSARRRLLRLVAPMSSSPRRSPLLTRFQRSKSRRKCRSRATRTAAILTSSIAGPIARSARWRSSARPSEWPAAPCFTHSYSTSRTVGERTNASGGSTARWPC